MLFVDDPVIIAESRAAREGVTAAEKAIPRGVLRVSAQMSALSVSISIMESGKIIHIRYVTNGEEMKHVITMGSVMTGKKRITRRKLKRE